MKFEKKLIYIAHSHKTQDECWQIILFVLKRSYVPLDPFTVFPPGLLDKMKLRKFERLGLDMKLLWYCDELWVFGETTYGVRKEIEWWKKHKPNIKIEYFLWEALDATH